MSLQCIIGSTNSVFSYLCRMYGAHWRNDTTLGRTKYLSDLQIFLSDFANFKHIAITKSKLNIHSQNLL